MLDLERLEQQAIYNHPGNKPNIQDVFEILRNAILKSYEANLLNYEPADVNDLNVDGMILLSSLSKLYAIFLIVLF